MFGRFRKYVLVALLLTVPLQGLAATLHALSCVEHDAPAAASGHVHAHSGGDHGASHPHPDESNGGADHSAHQCCHHFSSAVAPDVGGSADADLPPFQSSISLLATLFFPEQPQRPPRV